MKRHMLKPGTSTTFCGKAGKLSDAKHPADCQTCIQIAAGGLGKRRSPKFNFSVKSQPLDRWRVIVAKIKNRGAGL